MGLSLKVVSWTLAAIVGSSLIACSSTPAADESTEESFNDEGRIFVPASPQTSAQLGVATWVTTADGVMGLDQEGRIKSTAQFGDGRMDFYGEEHGDLAPFSPGTTAATSLQRAAEDLRAATASAQQGAQNNAVTSSLSPLKVNGGTGDGTGCRQVQGIGVRGTPMTKLVCPDATPPAKFEGCTGADGHCPVSGLICRSCGSPQPPAQQSQPAPSGASTSTCPHAGGSLDDNCPVQTPTGDDDDDSPQLTTGESPNLVRSCTTPPSCTETLGNYYSNKMLLAQCNTPDSCAYWDNMVKKDLPFVQNSGCAKCFGGR